MNEIEQRLKEALESEGISVEVEESSNSNNKIVRNVFRGLNKGETDPVSNNIRSGLKAAAKEKAADKAFDSNIADAQEKSASYRVQQAAAVQRQPAIKTAAEIKKQQDLVLKQQQQAQEMKAKATDVKFKEIPSATSEPATLDDIVKFAEKDPDVYTRLQAFISKTKNKPVVDEPQSNAGKAIDKYKTIASLNKKNESLDEIVRVRLNQFSALNKDGSERNIYDTDQMFDKIEGGRKYAGTQSSPRFQDERDEAAKIAKKLRTDFRGKRLEKGVPYSADDQPVMQNTLQPTSVVIQKSTPKNGKEQEFADAANAGKGIGLLTNPDDITYVGKARKLKKYTQENILINKNNSTLHDSINRTEQTIMKDLQEELLAIFGNEELSEEFKERVATVFEAAVNTRVNAIIDELQEEYTEYVETTLAEEVESIKEEYAEKIDDYVTYTASHFIEENRLVFEMNAKHKILESVVDGIKDVFANNYVEIDEEQVDLVEALVAEADEKEEKANQLLEQNIQLTKQVAMLKKDSIVKELGESLVDTDFAKFVELTESISFSNEEQFTQKCEHILESYFTDSKKPQAKVEEQIKLEESVAETKKQQYDPMSVYLKALSGNR